MTLTWAELREIIDRMPPDERSEKVMIFDCAANEFHEAELCVEGEPAVHLTIN